MSEILYGLDADKYHAMPGLSNSSFNALLQSPAHYQAWLKQNQIEINYTEYPKRYQAFKIGTLIHCAILEPLELSNRYSALLEKFDLRTKIGKQGLADFTDKAEGKIIITLDELHMANAIQQAIKAHDIASILLDCGHAEISIFSELDGVPCRCRPDYWNNRVIIDVKSTEDASDNVFPYSIQKYHYYRQAAFYIDVCASAGIEIENFLFLAVEKKEPYGIGIFELDADSLDYGRQEYKKCLALYKHCVEANNWPGYPEKITSVRLPGRMLQDL
jgi:exodeoxyribonuclease VIII